MHVNLSNLEISKSKAVLEVNGSTDTSLFKARLYQPFDFMDQIEEPLEAIFSGSVIRFFHKQSNGYLSVRKPSII